MNFKNTVFRLCLLVCTVFYFSPLHAQLCTLAATATTTVSECKATGSITLYPVNGSGNYNYIVTGPGYSSTTSSNIIAGLQAGVYKIRIKDIVTGCVVKLDSVVVDGTYQDPRFTIATTDVTCSGGNDGIITVNNVLFGKPPFSYAIVAPSSSGVGTTNATGIFTGLIAGSYTIQLSDSCGGIQTRVITMVNHTWSVTAIAASKVTCDSIRVTLTVTDNNGNTNIGTPANFGGYQYGYIEGSGDTVWSATPVFGFYKGKNRSASFVVKDPCGNTSVTIWTDNQVPKANATVSISNKNCTSFTANITGEQNLTNPRYCLYDAANVLQTCNNIGTFNNLPYGAYCINITDTCYDTTLTRCFTVLQPPPNVSNISISNKGCDSFTATVNTGNVSNGNYCLYDVNGTLIICNATGVFDNLAYGSYCVNVKNDPACYDTTMVSCFTVNKPVPAISNPVTITRGCGVFNAAISGAQNLTNPQYCLYDNLSNQLACNTTGNFSGLAFGSYCIHVANDTTCYDTTITKCFTVGALPVGIGISANPSCTIGATDVRIMLSNGVSPYIINIYDPSGNLTSTVNTSSATIHVNDLPGLPAGQKYKVVVAGNCGSLDSVLFTPRISSLSRSINLNAKCPGGVWQNGSGDLLINAVFSEGRVYPRLIKRDAITININYSTKSGNNFTFSNLQPGVYVIQYSLENCSNLVYDTFDLKAYDFPSLAQSSVFQCNNNSFNVNATATGGVNPYTYEIIGSTPALPAIIQGPQASPAFTITNGTTYSVVRLRAIDACGNATINDASILPLGNTVITASSDCFYNNINLSVDTIPGAVYTWYKKLNATDSILLGSGQVYNIPYMLPTDTGTYVSVASVNSGCLTKKASFHVTGACGFGVLPAAGILFNGSMQNGYAGLQWITDKAFVADRFLVERSIDGNRFEQVGVVNAVKGSIGAGEYLFTDFNTLSGRSFYRLGIVKQNAAMVYTRVIEINNLNTTTMQVLNNPVQDAFVLRFVNARPGKYAVSLISEDSRLVFNTSFTMKSNESRQITRPLGLAAGIYYLQVRDATGIERRSFTLVFK